MIKFLDLASQYESIKADVDAAIARTIATSAYIGGSGVAAFEAAFAAFQQAAHCVGVGNGTDAIEIALEALDLSPGGEVIVPANSFIASSEAVTRSGFRVVFADVNADDYTLDLDDVARRIGPQTVAIVAVHLYGHPCRMEGLLELARRHGLKVIEDCAQAHGAEFAGRRVGALGDIGTFSFYPGKNLGAYGDGGAILTNDDKLAVRCRMIANHGRVAKYDHEFEGRNSRLDGLQAAILAAKLPHLEGWINRRNEIAETYLAELASCPGIALPRRVGPVRHAFHLFVIRCAERDALAAHLKAVDIDTGVHYPIALPRLKAYAGHPQAAADLAACDFAGQLLSLPIGDHLDVGQARQVAAAVREFFRDGVV
ncbi:MAG: DegT/DnrJ/EryC1/StrS family aminotransferase [Rhodocyclaceae bacterium]|nr:MAG: DegT/DnrJ/EryC1/StrS family aminotransferase [Rhodocyclaceae bacterium]